MLSLSATGIQNLSRVHSVSVTKSAACHNNKVDRNEGDEKKGESRRKRIGRGRGMQKKEGEVEEEETNILQEMRLSGRPEVIRGHGWERSYYLSLI